MTGQGERHLFLSPHYDDIPLSCGGTVALLTSRGHHPEVALIFGDYPDPVQPLTSFANELHREWGFEADQVIDARRAEEATAAALIGSSDRFLPFRDAIYRGDAYVSNEAIFGPPANYDAGLPAEIASALDLGFSDKGSLTIYAPLAIGKHVDHQIAFLAGMELHQVGYTVRFYEDLPYALSTKNVEQRMSGLGDQFEEAEAIPIEQVWETKIDAILSYPSQLTMIFESYVGVKPTRDSISEAMFDYATAKGEGVVVEQFWKPAGTTP